MVGGLVGSFEELAASVVEAEGTMQQRVNQTLTMAG